MTADGIAKSFRFSFEPFVARRLAERHAGNLREARRRNQPLLVRLRGRAEGFDEMLGLPELARACFAKFIECADADHGFQFLAAWHNPMEEILHRREWTASVSGQDSLDRLIT